MFKHRPSRTRFSLALIPLLIGALLLPAPATLAASAAWTGEGNPGDFDARTATVSPTAAQVSAANKLGNVTWNRFGTPHDLIKYGGYLATGLNGSTAAAAARSWLNSNKALFKLNSTDASALELVSDIALVHKGKAHAVLFRQKFGGVIAAQDGMVNMGLVGSAAKGWKLAYVSSTIAGSAGAPAAAQITPQAAWLAAAHDVGLNVTAGDLYKIHTEADWTVFNVAGLAQLQRARLRALPIPGDGVRPVFEVDVQNVQGATVLANITMVDAVSKKIWFRWNAVDEAADQALTTPTAAVAAPVTGFFAGSTLAAGCGPLHAIPTTPATQTIDVAATANIPADDIVLKLIRNGVTIVSQDTGTSPEAVHYAPSGGVPVGAYSAQVCAFNTGQIFPYTGFWVTNDTAVEQIPYPPEWKAFTNTPKLNYSNTDNRLVQCWEKPSNVLDCNMVVGNIGSRSPWDFDPTTNSPTFTSVGNNAKTAEAWVSPLTPSENYAPVEADRTYYPAFTNQWYTSKCNPTVFTSPARNDIDAAIINLFVGHNRFHDFSYSLGFTEQAWNLQQSNFGNGQPGPYPGNENDPEIGNVQAGGIDGGAASDYRGRDNANQITLQDGVPGITNQYLFQPIPGGFYAPCVDGSYDTSVYGHEYTHAISNRMVGGPDSGLTGDQAGAMGESWGDLTALEYLHEFNFQPAGNASDWALGSYATGNPTTGIRNYPLDNNPLNYSDIGYDSACNTNLVGPPVEPYCTSRAEVHSDGEIWSAVNFDIRQLLVKKWNGSYPYNNQGLQRVCGEGKRAPTTCPGNRRWIQIMFDAFLLMPPDVSMLGARNAYLAADVMRGGQNQKELWHAFAKNGMGESATTTSTDDFDPKPGWTSPRETDGKIIFSAVNEKGQPIKAKIYVGYFEAGITPAADTDAATPLSNVWNVVSDHYTLIAVAPGYGAMRFQRNVPVGTQNAVLHFFPNWASATKGAVASGDGGNFADLIDETEATNWALIGATTVVGANVDVKFAAPHGVKYVQVSTMNHPADDDDDYDPEPQNRFAALYSFEIWGCLGSAGNGQCGGSAGWVKIGTFTNAFKAGIPRPLMPNMNIRQFDVTDMIADHLRVVVKDNQCTGNPAFAGEQDNDPTNSTDCETFGGQAGNVRIAELQAFSTFSYVVPSHE